jgi:excisionase family DNA binding protein
MYDLDAFLERGPSNHSGVFLLWLSVTISAFLDLKDGIGHQRIAMRWIFDENNIFFDAVCDQLGYAPDAVRQRIRKALPHTTAKIAPQSTIRHQDGPCMAEIPFNADIQRRLSELDKEWLTPIDAAMIFNVSRGTIKGWIRKGQLQSIKIVGSIRIPRQAIEKLINNQCRA